MATNDPGSLIRHLRRIVLRADGAGMNDGRLLKEFVFHRDPVAFESLVRRHGPMVMGVCRRILRDPHDAEDAFQSTFLVLACKAASVSPPEMIGNWLYGVAYKTATRLKAAKAKRRGREKQVTDMPEPKTHKKDFQDDLLQLFDEELARLPDKYRLPIVLCNLEGRTRKEIARQFQISEGTLSSRLTTARRMLARRLARRGLAVSGGSLSAALSQNATSACISVSLVSSTVKAATLAAAGQTTTRLLSAQAAAVTEGVLKDMFLTKLKPIMGTVLVVAALSSAAGLIYRAQAAEQRKAQQISERADQEKQLATKKDHLPKPDKEQLQGKWKIISTIEDGEELKDGAGEFKEWTFQDTTIWMKSQPKHMKGGTANHFGRFKLDETAKPKSIDIWDPALALDEADQRLEGIYSLDGDTLKICWGVGKRPMTFESKRGSDHVLIVLTRKSAKPQLKKADKIETATEKPDKNKQTAGQMGPKPLSDKERLQGTWKLLCKDKGFIDGKWTIKGMTIRVESRTKEEDKPEERLWTWYHRFRLDETANPKKLILIDGEADDLFDIAEWEKRFDDPDQQAEGIYSLDGDVMKICLRANKWNKRPASFDSEEGILISLKRETQRDGRSKGDKRDKYVSPPEYRYPTPSDKP